MRRAAAGVGLLAGALALGCATGGDTGGPAASRVASGKTLFEQHCAACHGVDARGGGPVASAMTVAPPDLTRLGEKYGSPLPAARLAEFIDGRSMVAAHGRSDMPVWGRDLYRDVPVHAATEAQTRTTIRLIIDYLDTLQPGQ
ncbi:MAG: c-type cytochrome [Myxococcota bacterium]